MEYLIRDCEPNDISVLIDLCQKHAAYERASFSPIGKEEKLQEALFGDHPQLFCLVVEVNETIVGYASFTFDFSTWDAATFIYMDCLYLEEDARGFGIGEALIDKLKQIAKDKNCINIQWQTPEFNTRAIKFYRRIGGIGKDKVRFFLNL
ncbi:GNAT family N-acetyltransferase [Flavobacterium aquicola]|uniref:Ribosomal protein S18 acetylase RimI-like enzyme n=1 Tax=Flavobacterium aquicola TaxID=1682742 RepID=A0A3E0E1X7_9FLAO|nr:GNAT family N-acetyltransferase [Flavobacterium aquicola]REG92185.1 ribosomal protein S18 acetylase RimI-like enzyme [Flavobacterium aquicola]